MSYQPSVLERLQLNMVGRLMDEPKFQYAAIFAVRPRSAAEATMIQNNINASLSGLQSTNGKSGVTLLVDIASAVIPFQEVRGPELTLQPALRIIENPLINMGANGTQKSAEQYAFDALQLFHGWRTEESGGTMNAAKNPYRQNVELLQKNQVGYTLYFETIFKLKPPTNTATPAIAGDSVNGVTIKIPAGSVGYYTLDGTYPAASNAAAVLLNTPLLDDQNNPVTDSQGNPVYTITGSIPVTIGTLVSAVATLPNQQASNLAAKYIS